MYFKISLLFCALYFFTVVRSIGLSEGQITSCVQLLEKYITKQTIAVINDKTMPELLIKLALEEKESDDWEENGLTTFEVRLFVRMFTIQDQKIEHDGLLTYAELENLIDDGLNLERDVKEEIKKELKNGDSINAQKFLAAILKYKPEGKGLDKIQIQRCFKVYNCNYDHYPTASLKELLQSLHIVSNDYDSLFEFEHFQTAANELKELLVLWSEYNKDVDANLPLFTSTQVREHIDNFTLYDKDNNGILDYWEFEPVGNLYFPIYKPITIFKRYSDLYFTPECLEFAPVIKRRKAGADGDDILNKTYSMSTAMFLNMKYFLIFGKKNNIKKVSTSVAMEETNEMPTNLTNVMANLNVTTEETNLRRNRGSRLPFFGCCGNP